jgi:TRAP-type mannitol/chloroaromatic compound transport system substrate-binding protein
VEAASSANHDFALNQYSTDLQKLQTDHGVTVRRTPQSILDAELTAWDALIVELGKDPFMQKIMDSQRAWVERVVLYELTNAPDYQLAYEHYFPGKLPKI